MTAASSVDLRIVNPPKMRNKKLQAVVEKTHRLVSDVLNQLGYGGVWTLRFTRQLRLIETRFSMTRQAGNGFIIRTRPGANETAWEHVLTPPESLPLDEVRQRLQLVRGDGTVVVGLLGLPVQQTISKHVNPRILPRVSVPPSPLMSTAIPLSTVETNGHAPEPKPHEAPEAKTVEEDTKSEFNGFMRSDDNVALVLEAIIRRAGRKSYITSDQLRMLLNKEFGFPIRNQMGVRKSLRHRKFILRDTAHTKSAELLGYYIGDAGYAFVQKMMGVDLRPYQRNNRDESREVPGMDVTPPAAIAAPTPVPQEDTMHEFLAQAKQDKAQLQSQAELKNRLGNLDIEIEIDDEELAKLKKRIDDLVAQRNSRIAERNEIKSKILSDDEAAKAKARLKTFMEEVADLVS